MDAYIKPEVQKTIKRLSQQKNHEVLKNKLRSWIITRELSVTDLIRACREKTIQVSPAVLNKLGILYGSGKEGLNEEPETAFIFYLAAADLGNATAAGNVAQYYFDGRAPGGRNIDSAYEFCHKAVEGGVDKFMLLSEILHEKRDYKETVRCLRKIIEVKKVNDTLAKKKVEARKLEIQCLFKLLDRLFVKVPLFEVYSHQATDQLLSPPPVTQQQQPPPQPPQPPQYIGEGSSSLALPVVSPLGTSSSVQAPFSPQASMSPGVTSKSLSIASSGPATPGTQRRGLVSPVIIPSSRPASSSLGLSASYMLNSNSTTGFQTAYKSIVSDLRNESKLRPLVPSKLSSPSRFSDPTLFQHHLPGWSYISDELEGFDKAACSQLTARAEVLELEAEALRSAYETAEQRVSHGKRLQFSDEVINVLMKNKVHEFHDLYHTLQRNKATLLQTWNYFTDTSEHILRRQIIAEKRFFNPKETSNPLILLLARELFHRRMYDYAAYLDADWSTFYTPEKHLNEPLHLSAMNNVAYRIPPARILLTAERSLVEVAMETYGRSTAVQHTQQTGWAGQFNLAIFPSGILVAGPQWGMEEGKASSPLPPTGLSLTKISSSSLLQEMTFTETILIGSSVLRYNHRTYPLLPPPTYSPAPSSSPTSRPASPSRPHAASRDATSRPTLHRDFSASSNSHSTQHSFSDLDLIGFENYYSMQDLGNSDDILRFFNRLTLMTDDIVHYKENEKKLVELIVRFLREGRPFHLTEVQMINDEATEQDCTTLTRVAYHYFVKRLIPWVLPIDDHARMEARGLSSSSALAFEVENKVPYYSDTDLPLASAQARALQLIAHGVLRFSEVFEYQSPYGIFYFRDGVHDSVHESSAQSTADRPSTGRQTYSRLREQIININSLYQKAVLEASSTNFAAYIEFWKTHVQGSTVPTYQRLFRELIDVYGDPDESEESEPYGSEDRELDDLMGRLKI